MRSLVLGAGGFLGSHMDSFFEAKRKNFDYFLDTQKYNSTNSINNFLRDMKPSLIINCIALIGSAECEKRPEEAYWVNGHLPGVIAEYCRTEEARLIHISTDAVMDTNRSFKCEKERPFSKGTYGSSKLLGEELIVNSRCDYLICRVNFFGFSNKQSSLLDFFTNKIKKGEACKGYENVWFTPLGVESLIKNLQKLEKSKLKGIIHITGNDRISKYQFGKEVESILGSKEGLVSRGTINIEGDARIKDLSLCNCKLQSLIAEPLLNWKLELRSYLTGVRGKNGN